MNSEERPKTLEPEKIAVKSPEQTLKAMEANIAALKERAERSKREREELLKRKLVEREQLIANAEKVDGLHKDAVKFRDSMKPLLEDEFMSKDPEVVRQAEEAENLVKSLETQAEEINQSIAGLENNEEIFDGMEAEAVGENVRRDKIAGIERTKEEMNRSATAFVDDLNKLVEEYNAWYPKNSELTAAANKKKDEIQIIVATTLSSTDGKYDDISSRIRTVFQSSGIRYEPTTEKMEGVVKGLREIRKSIGILGGKNKKLIDDVVEQIESVDFKQANEECENWKKKYAEIEASAKSLTEKYRTLREVYSTKGLYFHDAVDNVVRGKGATGQYKNAFSLFNEIYRAKGI